MQIATEVQKKFTLNSVSEAGFKDFASPYQHESLVVWHNFMYLILSSYC